MLGNLGEVCGLAYLEKLKKVTFGRRQRGVRQHLQQVAKVVAAVERNPLYLLSTQRQMSLLMHMQLEGNANNQALLGLHQSTIN